LLSDIIIFIIIIILCYKYICVTEREGHVDHDVHVDVLSYQYLYCQSPRPLCLLSCFNFHIEFIS